jgi:hypothetical protein
MGGVPKAMYLLPICVLWNQQKSIIIGRTGISCVGLGLSDAAPANVARIFGVPPLLFRLFGAPKFRRLKDVDRSCQAQSSWNEYGRSCVASLCQLASAVAEASMHSHDCLALGL